MVHIAFFDLDKTLIARNSAALWLRSEFLQGRISKWQALRAVAWMVRYHVGSVDLLHAIERSIGTLAGSPEAELRARTHDFFEREVRHLVRPGAMQALKKHRTRGDRVVLLTSSSNYLSECVQQMLGLDDFLATHLGVDAGGHFTGRAVPPVCFGDGKVIRAQAYADQVATDLRHCTFYSDSMSDLPMFEAVGSPVAVNPDPRLRRVARRRGWQIYDWGRPAPSRP